MELSQTVLFVHSHTKHWEDQTENVHNIVINTFYIFIADIYILSVGFFWQFAMCRNWQ